jgi:hypothetical protein
LGRLTNNGTTVGSAAHFVATDTFPTCKAVIQTTDEAT